MALALFELRRIIKNFVQRCVDRFPQFNIVYSMIDSFVGNLTLHVKSEFDQSPPGNMNSKKFPKMKHL